jgi:5-methylcytosine-specific restriction endonuclease McrA
MEGRKNDGRFLKGVRSHPETEFKKGQHWRPRALYWDREWLRVEYEDKERSSSEIAADFGITDNAILFWLDKHQIPRRTIREARGVKHWSVSGEKNGMRGRTGERNPNWRGGCSPERQAFYSSAEWAEVVPKVWARDNYQCQRCGASSHGLHIHHLETFANKKCRADMGNLVLLCKSCHNFVHSRKNIEGEFINALHLRPERDPGSP